MVQLRRMFLLSSSAVLGTYSFPPPFLRPLFGMNSLTHSPLTAAISLKHRGGQGHGLPTVTEKPGQGLYFKHRRRI